MSATDTPYQLAVDGLATNYFDVHRLKGKEAISEAYSFEVVVTGPEGSGDEDVERVALGQRATLTFNIGKTPRVFYGVVAAVRVIGARDAGRRTEYELTVAPQLWLLKRKRNTRIFQNMRVPDVVNQVLLQAGIGKRWQLTRSYPVRAYCTQYEESDYAFVKRLLAEAGIFFYFAQGGPVSDAEATVGAIASAAGSAASSAVSSFAGSAAGSLVSSAASAVTPLIPGDTVICADDASFYPSLGADDAAALEAATLAGDAAEVGAVVGGLGAVGDAALGAAGAVAGDVIAAATSSAARSLYYLDHLGGSVKRADRVTKFVLRTSVRANMATFRDYDPDRPQAKLESVALSNDPFPMSGLEQAAAAATEAGSVLGNVAPGPVGAIGSAVAENAGAVATGIESIAGDNPPPLLGVYDHHGDFLFPSWSFAGDEASRMLRQRRRRTSIARGESGCSDMGAGHRFALNDHPVSHLDQEYVVTSVEHRGVARPVTGTESGPWRVYENAFECAPATMTYVPPRPKRKSIQVALTARVVGPEGTDIHVNEKGEIKVQFHWDRDGKLDDKSSCWIRTMHPWAGAGWGVQFIARVGMEVVVTFEGGDPDKPMVIGSLYNGTHPPPFSLPSDKTRSGWRTQSSPGGGGFNELSFEDQVAHEQVYLHAQRDFDTVVEHDHSALVKNDELLKILGNRIDRIEKHLDQHIGGDSSTAVQGNRIEAVSGDRDERVSGTAVTRFEGKEVKNVAGAAALTYADDLTLRVLGCSTTIVGRNDKKRSWMTHAEGSATLSGVDRLELTSETEVVLSVGKSSIRIASDRIELSSPTISSSGDGGAMAVSDAGLSMRSKDKSTLTLDKGVLLKTNDASVSLGTEIKADGAKILLNSPDVATDPPPVPPEPPTNVELVDQNNKPLAYQRFLVQTDDGTQIGGKTDKDGKAELALKSSGKILFPDLTMPGDTSDKGDMQPLVVRQGDYLTKLAFVHGFDADAVWNDPKNADLKAKRTSPDQLLPGDVLNVPAKKKEGLAISKGTSNHYDVNVPTAQVIVVFKLGDEALANEVCEVHGLGDPSEGDPPKTDGDGKLTLDVPVLTREVVVAFPNREGMLFHFFIGDMDPGSDQAGIDKRLTNLGYLPAPGGDEDANAIDAKRRAAVTAFQTSQGLTATGDVDDATRQALIAAHQS
jgi:type VI secretion system secreted protein VgrG